METVQEAQGSRSYEEMKAQLGLVDEKPAEAPVTPPIDDGAAQANVTVAPTEEPKVESPPAEAQPQEGVPSAETEPKEETIFEVNDFNKLFESEFEDLDSVKTALASAKRIGELETQITELEALKQENLLLKENLDPMKYFASEDDYKIAQFKKQFPDKDASVAYKLFSADLTNVSDREVIAQGLLLDNPDLDGGLQGALAMIDKKYGIEEGEELDGITKNELKVDARSARATINSLKSQIKLPDKIDVNSLATQQKELLAQRAETLKQGWGGIAKEASRTLPDIVVTDKDADGKEVEVFRYSVGKDFPQETVDGLVDYMVNAGIDINQGAAQSMIDVMQKEYLQKNLSNIVKAVRNDTLAKAEEERLKKQHNPGAPKAETPPVEPKKGDQDKLLSDLNKGWQPTQLFK